MENIDKTKHESFSQTLINKLEQEASYTTVLFYDSVITTEANLQQSWIKYGQTKELKTAYSGNNVLLGVPRSQTFFT